MSWIEAFKPNKWKLIVSAVLTAIFVFFIKIWNYSALEKMCAPCIHGGFDNCSDYYSWMIVKEGCHCSCTQLSEVLMQYVNLVIIPFLLVYLVYSIVELARK